MDFPKHFFRSDEPKTTWPERILSRLFPLTTIRNCEGDVYLLRWKCLLLGKDGETFRVYVHKFVSSDEDRALHDHPANFIVVPIWRGYWEYNRAGKRRVRPLLGMRFRLGSYAHRVELAEGKPAWSVFFRFRPWRTWGFWPAEGFIPFNQWWTKHCE